MINSSLLPYKEFYSQFGEYREEIVSNALKYRGWAPDGALDSEAKWAIEREIIYGGVTRKTQAGEGVTVFEQVWDDRASLFPAIPFEDFYSLIFDGVNDYVDLGNNFNFERTSPFSMSFWIYQNAISGSQILFSKRLNTTVAGIQLGILSGRPELFLVNTQTTNQIRAQAPTALNFAAGVWNHLVVTYSGSSAASGVKFYQNNILGATAITTDNLTASILTATNAYMGAIGTTGYFNGIMDEVSIWNTELTAAQVNEIFNGGHPKDLNTHSAYSSLLSWWRMGDGDTYPVLSDNKGFVNGSMTNMATTSFIAAVP